MNKNLLFQEDIHNQDPTYNKKYLQLKEKVAIAKISPTWGQAAANVGIFVIFFNYLDLEILNSSILFISDLHWFVTPKF